MTKPASTEEKRLELHGLLKRILGSDLVYFQPPNDKKLSYPCIVYQLSRMDTEYSANYPYLHFNSYTITYISRTPDTRIPDMLKEMQCARFDRFFTTDSLNHYVFRLTYN